AMPAPRSAPMICCRPASPTEGPSPVVPKAVTLLQPLARHHWAWAARRGRSIAPSAWNGRVMAADRPKRSRVADKTKILGRESGPEGPAMNELTCYRFQVDWQV